MSQNKILTIIFLLSIGLFNTNTTKAMFHPNRLISKQNIYNKIINNIPLTLKLTQLDCDYILQRIEDKFFNSNAICYNKNIDQFVNDISKKIIKIKNIYNKIIDDISSLINNKDEERILKSIYYFFNNKNFITNNPKVEQFVEEQFIISIINDFKQYYLNNMLKINYETTSDDETYSEDEYTPRCNSPALRELNHSPGYRKSRKSPPYSRSTKKNKGRNRYQTRIK